MNHAFDNNYLPASNGELLPPADNNLFVRTVNDIHKVTGSPIELVMAATLGAINTVQQGRLVAEDQNGNYIPTSLYIICSAPSGAGKSPAFKYAFDPIFKTEKEMAKVYSNQLKEYKAAQDLWNKRYQALLKSDYSDMSAHSRALVQHQYQKPTKPKRFKLNYGNSTYESIIDGISSDYPFISIASAEGGSELNSRIFKNLAILNSLWSNEPFTVSRKSSGSIEISDAGLSLTIMTQPIVLEKFSQKNSSDVIGSGYLARLMPCRALSGRLSHTISRSEAANLFDYEQRMQEILDQSVTAFHEENARKVMRLSPEAKLYCQNLEQEIRAGMAPNGRFDGAIEHASKLLDNTIRIAANIHYFCYNDSEISGISMQMAAGIAAYFSDEYRAMFVRPPAYIQNAMLLNDWLNQFRAGQTFIRKNFILQNGPNTLRKSSLVTEALSVLTQHGQVRVFQEGRTIWVNINPQMYSDVLPSELMEKPKNNSLNNQILGDKP